MTKLEDEGNISGENSIPLVTPVDATTSGNYISH